MHTHYMRTKGRCRQDTTALLTQLGRVGGHARAVQQMIAEGRSPAIIVRRLRVIATVTDSIADHILVDQIHDCIADMIRQRRGDEALSEVVSALAMVMRRN